VGTSSDLDGRIRHHRAIEALIWGMPAVYFDLLVQAARRVNAGFNQVVYWSQLTGWLNQTLTPNPDCVYFIPLWDTSGGPVVVEVPPADGGSITGSLMNSWQAALEDVGPAGLDKGNGGKYLILPPGYGGEVPDGYLVLPSDTFRGFGLLRSNLTDTSPATAAAGVEYGKRVKVYPLAAAADPPPTVFADAYGVQFGDAIPYDARFYESLDRVVQAEPWLTRDKVMINTLRGIGIVKGVAFRPDQAARDALTAAAAEARTWIDEHYEGAFAEPYFEGASWAVPAPADLIKGQATSFADPDSYPVDERGVLFSIGYFSAKHPGAGQFYLMAIVDGDGRPLDGAQHYRLRVPPDPPVERYWSATVYDRETHLYLRDQNRLSCASNDPGVHRNADGSVDAYFGPTPPPSGTANWVPTVTGRGFEVIFRLYGPTQPLFDKTWRLPDIERLDA